MKVDSYGGGTNSKGLLVGMWERGERPDLILFSDTGGEKPETYADIAATSAWCESIGFPPIITIRRHTTVSKLERVGTYSTLEEECLAKNALPSVAYGFKACSQKYKIQPQEKFCNSHWMCLAVWAMGGKVQKLIGIDAGESHRTQPSSNPKYENVYPLIEWGWGREECVEAIARAGLPQPGKSSCFFCPNSKPHEIIALSDDLKARAVAMEDRALAADMSPCPECAGSGKWRRPLYAPEQYPEDDDAEPCAPVGDPIGYAEESLCPQCGGTGEKERRIKGLGRDWSWRSLIQADAAQVRMFGDPPRSDMPCGCYDG